MAASRRDHGAKGRRPGGSPPRFEAGRTFAPRGGALTDGLTSGLTAALAREANPEVAAMVAEETHLLLERLGSSQLQAIAVWRMEGYTTDEIATRLGCTRRTVAASSN